jgi:ATP-dependent Clp protease ATP-binding subunit ClpA
MIRLNNASKTRINEKDISLYRPKDELGLPVITMVICGDVENLYYNNEQLRDKDIELLDKIFDIKSIEDKANAYPHEIDALKFAIAMSDIKKEFAPVKEEYITWEEIKNSKKIIEVKMPNGDIHSVYYEENEDRIQLGVGNGYIYDEDLFNA